MRLNNEMREFITDKIMEKAYDNAELKELEAKKEAVIEECNTKIEEMESEFTQRLRDVLSNYNYSSKDWQGKESLPSISVTGFNYNGFKEHRDWNAKRRELEKIAKEKTRNIVFEIQLGGTKDMLMEMIDAVSFDE